MRYLQPEKDKKTITLNFTEAEKGLIRNFLSRYPEKPTTAYFEEKRWQVNGCTVTLYTSGKLVVQGNGCSKVSDMLVKSLLPKQELIFGIDETGRGEKVGAFVICGVLADNNKMRELRDSKKLELSKIDEKAKVAQKNSMATLVLICSPDFVDLVRKNGSTLNELQRRFLILAPQFFKNLGFEFSTKADGGPIDGVTDVEFIIKGDDICATIGAASIIAKSVRDNFPNKAERKTWS
ncbi:MAG: DUF3378 domain-containing protein [Candidatus Diapherotrites archaeon]|nr:DUF3378 domain-containing protein [Candidatus Diapherotrites archaeon]